MEILQSIEDFLMGAQKLYWFLAIFGTTVMIIMFIMTLFGFGSHGDADVDADGNVEFGEHADGGLGVVKFFSVRAVIGFFTFFGWGGVFWGKNGWSGFFAATACGLAMMFITGLILIILLRLQHSGNISAADLVGNTGTVYFSIPSGRVQTGKVTVKLDGCTREIHAIADEEIPSGASVKVLEDVDGKRFLVERI